MKIDIFTIEGHEWRILSGLGIGPAVLVPVNDLDGLTSTDIGYLVLAMAPAAKKAQADYWELHEDPKADPRAGMIPKDELEAARAEFNRLRKCLWNSLIAKSDPICIKCGIYDITMDHIVPLSRGGQNTVENLQWLCRSCNAKKGTTHA